jgi:hypothetical protein
VQPLLSLCARDAQRRNSLPIGSDIAQEVCYCRRYPTTQARFTAPMRFGVDLQGRERRCMPFVACRMFMSLHVASRTLRVDVACGCILCVAC